MFNIIHFLGIWTPEDLENPQLESSFARLPEEILLKIFSSMDDLTFANTKLTCRKWNRITAKDNPIQFAKINETITQIRQNIGQNMHLFFKHNEHLHCFNEIDNEDHPIEVTSLCLWLDEIGELSAITQQFKPTRFEKRDPDMPCLEQSIAIMDDSLKNMSFSETSLVDPSEQIKNKKFNKINFFFKNLSFYQSETLGTEDILHKTEISPPSDHSKALAYYLTKTIHGSFHTTPYRSILEIFWSYEPENNFANWFRIFIDPENYPNEVLFKNEEVD